jgi:alkylhydroperoxidase family enzyme
MLRLSRPFRDGFAFGESKTTHGGLSMSRLDNISLDGIPELEGVEEMYETVFGFVPNGVRIMARRPGIVQGFLHLRRSVFDPATSKVPLELKSLVGHIASKTAGCRYCQAHAIYGSDRSGTNRARLEALWDFETSDLFDEAERVALRLAVSAAASPNGVTDEDFVRMSEYWDDGQIVEILAVVALYGFLNRWNDSLATTLEEPSQTVTEEVLASKGWEVGKHRRDEVTDID